MSKPKLPSLDDSQAAGLPEALASSRERAGLAQVLGYPLPTADSESKQEDSVARSPEPRAGSQDHHRLERMVVDMQADFMEMLSRVRDLEVGLRSLRAELQALRDRR